MRKAKMFSVSIIAVLSMVFLFACTPMRSEGRDYSVFQLDLSVRPEAASDARFDDLYSYVDLDQGDAGEDYLAHPDSVLLYQGTPKETIMTVYPAGHGRGPVLMKTSTDGGMTYSARAENTPTSWESSEETPTIYELDFKDGSKKLVLISANPKWPGYRSGDGFHASFADFDESTQAYKAFSEFEKFYGKDSDFKLEPIVAMSTLVRLKENGEFVDKWMGLFHDRKFKNYKTILTFEEGKMNWSRPEEYFKGVDDQGKPVTYFDIAKKTNMCEVEVIRSDNGLGDRLCLISRSNTKKYNSLISFSDDEGETWSNPKEAPAALNGERHKAEYTADGRLLITFRSIERSPEKIKLYKEKSNDWYSEGLIAWVGSFEDLEKGTEGDYRIKLAHTYLPKQEAPARTANGDTGYCGVVCLSDGTFVISAYGIFDKDLKNAKGERKTTIISKRVHLDDTDALVALLR